MHVCPSGGVSFLHHHKAHHHREPSSRKLSRGEWGHCFKLVCFSKYWNLSRLMYTNFMDSCLCVCVHVFVYVTIQSEMKFKCANDSTCKKEMSKPSSNGKILMFFVFFVRQIDLSCHCNYQRWILKDKIIDCRWNFIVSLWILLSLKMVEEKPIKTTNILTSCTVYMLCSDPLVVSRRVADRTMCELQCYPQNLWDQRMVSCRDWWSSTVSPLFNEQMNRWANVE